jgi:hypothetical protein
MTLSRIIRAVHGEQFSLIRPRWLTGIFVFGDCFSFLIQGSGAGLLVQGASGDGGSGAQMGENIILGGLIFQVAMFAGYLVVAFVFHTRFLRRSDPGSSPAHIPWRRFLLMLYLTSFFIMARNVFRAIEYAMGHDGYLLSHEWPVYVFDGALMLFTMIAFLFQYPSGLVGRTDKGSDEEGYRLDSSERAITQN